MKFPPSIADKWDWHALKGSKECLRLNRRELRVLDEIIQTNVRPSHRTIAVQAGGNLGLFPKFLAHHFAHVYTFEPSADLFPLLCRNAPETNISRFQAALSDIHGGITTVCERRYRHHMEAHEGITHVKEGGSVPK